jgi:GxxExxY protein
MNRLAQTHLEAEFRQMLHHKGVRKPAETPLKETSDPAERLAYKIVGAALKVHQQLGPGLLESAYEACLCRELALSGIAFERQVPLAVQYHGISLDCGYRLDLVVGELVIVEVKAVAKVLPIHRAQLMTYLKLLKLRIGLIINFNVTALRLGIYRIIQG